PPRRDRHEPTGRTAPTGPRRTTHPDRRQCVRADGSRRCRCDPSRRGGGSRGGGAKSMNEASKTGQTDAGATTSAGLPGHLTPFIRGMALIARIGLRVTTRVRIEGDLDAIPRSGPLIITANHLSNADGIMVGGWLTPALGRRDHRLATGAVT